MWAPRSRAGASACPRRSARTGARRWTAPPSAPSRPRRPAAPTRSSFPGDLWDAENVPAARRSTASSRRSRRSRRGPSSSRPGTTTSRAPGGCYDPAVLAALGMRAWPGQRGRLPRVRRGRRCAFPGRDDVDRHGPRVPVARRRRRAPARTAARRARRRRTRSCSCTARSRATRGRGLAARHEAHGALLARARSSTPGSRGRRSATTTRPMSSRTTPGVRVRRLLRLPDGPRPRRDRAARLPQGHARAEARPPRVETLPADSRVVHDLTVDATELEAAALAERIETALGRRAGSAPAISSASRSPGRSRSARGPPRRRARSLRASSTSRCATTTAPPTEETGLRSAEGRFAADLRARRDAARRRGARGVSPSSRLRLGRDALAGRPVLPPEPEDA